MSDKEIPLISKRSYSNPAPLPYGTYYMKPQLMFNSNENIQPQTKNSIEFNQENYESFYNGLPNIQYSIDEITERFNKFFQMNPPLTNRQFGLLKVNRNHFNHHRGTLYNKSTTIYTKKI